MDREQHGKDQLFRNQCPFLRSKRLKKMINIVIRKFKIKVRTKSNL